MNKAHSLQRRNLLYGLVQAMYFAAFAAFCGFQTVFLLDRGFTGGEAGMLASIRCLAGIIAQPLLGGWLDRHPQVRLKRVLTLMLLISVVVNTLFYCTRPSLFPTAVITFVLGALDLNLYPLVDSLGLQFINAGVDLNYSLSRGAGSLAYAVSCAVMGLISSSMGAQSVVLAHTLLLSGVIVSINLFPEPPKSPTAQHHGSPHTIFQILRANPSFTLMLLAVFFAVGAVLPIAGFLINVIEPLGGNDSHLGLALFLMGISELPSALLYPKLQRRFGSRSVMVLAVIGMAAKPLVFLLTGSLSLLLAAQIIQMLGYGLFTPAAVYYANDNVPPADRIRGQAIMMTASNGLGGMVGNLLTGFAVDLGGAKGMLLLSFSMALCGVACTAASLRSAKKN